MDILLYFGGPALIAFLIQFLVGCRTQHKILRYIPIYCFVITLAFAIIALCLWRGTGREPRGGGADKASPRGLCQLLS